MFRQVDPDMNEPEDVIQGLNVLLGEKNTPSDILVAKYSKYRLSEWINIK